MDNEEMNTPTSWYLRKVSLGKAMISLTAGNVDIDSDSRWKWPNIPGIHDFKGHKVHSADWDHSFDYSHKRIGIIGNGSSGIQILPQMAKLPGVDITAFQRNPTWITQSLGTILGVGEGEPDDQPEEEGIDMSEVDKDDDQVGNNFNPAYTSLDRRRFANKEKHKAYRKMLQGGMNKGFRLVSDVLVAIKIS
jgi:cation diffusion facilitator CzcD-associated flavoprotein CzcO